MTDTSDESPKEARERLEHGPDATQARLLDGLDTLDDRRDRARRVLERAGDAVKRHKALLVGVAAGILVAVVLIARARRRRARQRPGEALARAAKNLLGPAVVEPVERRDRHALGTVAKAGIGIALRIADEMSKRPPPERRAAESAARG
jgi:ElaB/YqjD/DUF883 family membrane-anchored ribosome-binding protein